MPNPEGELPNFENLDLPLDKTILTEPVPGASPSPAAGAEAPVEAAPAAAPDAPVDAAPAAAPGLAAFAVDTLGGEPTDETPSGEEKKEEGAEEGEEEEKEKKPGFFARVAKSNPYTVLLGISLLALTVAVLALVWEWRSYHWTTKRQSIRKEISAPAQAAPISVAALPYSSCCA